MRASASIRTNAVVRRRRPRRAPPSARARARGRSGGDRPRLLPRLRPTRCAAAAFRASTRSCSELGKPVVIHTRAADEDTLAVTREASTARSILHCFSSPALLEPALERGWYVSFAGNVTYPKAPELREAAQRVPADRLLAETDSPYLAPQAGPRQAERAGVRRAHRRHARRGARGGCRRARRSDRRQRDRGVRAVNVVPKKQLGQHFLVDENILGVIERPRRPAGGRCRAGDRPGPRGAHAVPRRSASRTSTRSSSTAVSSRELSDIPRTDAPLGGRARRSTSARSSRLRPSSSPICPTTSPRRSLSRASTVCRGSRRGA